MYTQGKPSLAVTSRAVHVSLGFLSIWVKKIPSTSWMEWFTDAFTYKEHTNTTIVTITFYRQSSTTLFFIVVFAIVFFIICQSGKAWLCIPDWVASSQLSKDGSRTARLCQLHRHTGLVVGTVGLTFCYTLLIAACSVRWYGNRHFHWMWNNMCNSTMRIWWRLCLQEVQIVC